MVVEDDPEGALHIDVLVAAIEEDVVESELELVEAEVVETELDVLDVVVEVVDVSNTAPTAAITITITITATTRTRPILRVESICGTCPHRELFQTFEIRFEIASQIELEHSNICYDSNLAHVLNCK